MLFLGWLTSISSQFYPRNYLNNCYNRWNLWVPSGKKINFRFAEDFAIEQKDSACSNDYVNVVDGNGEVLLPQKWGCGYRAPAPFQSKTNQATVTFKTDYSETRAGFKLYYESGTNGHGLKLYHLSSLINPHYFQF